MTFSRVLCREVCLGLPSVSRSPSTCHGDFLRLLITYTSYQDSRPRNKYTTIPRFDQAYERQDRRQKTTRTSVYISQHGEDLRSAERAWRWRSFPSPCRPRTSSYQLHRTHKCSLLVIVRQKCWPEWNEHVSAVAGIALLPISSICCHPPPRDHVHTCVWRDS